MKSPCRKAEIVEVIKVIVAKGNGKDEPLREVVEYWTKDGDFISEGAH